MSISNVNNFVPVNYATTPTGLLFMATGIGPMIKWDGLAANLTSVGVVAPLHAPTLAFSGSGLINGTYTAYLRYVDNLGNVSNASPISLSAVATNAATLTYSGLDVPTIPPFASTFDIAKIAKRQLLRNTNGQASTYYIDIETTDLTSTTLTSTSTDSALTALTAVPSTDLFTFSVPPTTKSVIANHLGRMFAAGDVVYDVGNIIVTNGSPTIFFVGAPGVGAIFDGRQILINGASKPYLLVADSSLAGISLTTPYTDASDQFASYAIRPTPDQRRLIYYSKGNLPEAWPATNAISVQEDGDEITGLMPFSSFLYILEEHHIYRFTFQTDPLTDGGIFLALNRGCINQRCWVLVEGTAYMLDDQGIHAFGGARDSDPISSTIQDLFRFSDSPLRINWAASRWFHAVHYSSQEVIRWFVALSGSYLPYHALCYNYRQKRWWVEQWPVPIGASALGRLGVGTKVPQVYLGSSAGRILGMWQGTLDGPDPTQGTVRGQVTAGGSLDTIQDAKATFATSGLVDNPISIVDGTGKGQQRIVTSVSGSTIQVKQPWRIKPDTTSVYQLGGIQWRVQFGWWRTLLYEEANERYFAVVFQTCLQPALATMQMFTDFSSTPTPWKGDFTLADGDGARTVKDSPDVTLDFTKPSGYIKKRFPGHREFFADGVRYISFALSGVTNQDPQRIYYVTCGGADQGG